MAVELFANLPQTTVSSGGTTAPAGGTQETWTVASSSSFPAASSGASPPTQFHVADVAANSELIAVISVSGTTWTVTRGAEGTTPVAHAAGFSVFQVVTAGALTALQEIGCRLIYADQYGADPTGAADSTAAIVAAQAAGGSGKYLIILSAGTYVWGTSGDIGTFGAGQGLAGQGSAVTAISYAGSGTCISSFEASFNSADIAGRFAGFTIDGTNAGAAAVGMRAGNLQCRRGQDITIQNFTGASAIGLNFLNTSGTWSEEAEFTAIKLLNCANHVVFDTGSFDYSVYQFTIVANPGQNGVTVRNGANLAGVRLEVRGNFLTGAGNNAWVIGLDPGAPTAGSSVSWAQFDVNVESDGSTGTGHFTILLGGGSSCQFTGQGVLYFRDGAVPFQGASLGTAPSFGVSGIVSDHVLGKMTPGSALAVHGASQYKEYGSVTTAVPATVFLDFGDVQSFQLANGGNTVAFSASDLVRARRIDLFLAQPASGAAGTVTWPATVAWPGNGSAPQLSATNSVVDHVRLYYVPSAGKYYGEFEGGAYSYQATVPVLKGGTGKTTQAAALTALTGTQSAGTYVRSDGTNAALSAIQAGDVPDLSATYVTLSGTQTVTGAKTFSLPPNLATQSVSSAAALNAASAPVVLTDTTSAAFTLTLPAAPVTGEWFVIIDDTGQWNTHNLTVGRNGKNIDGATANLTLANQWGKIWLYYDGTAWWSLANGLSNETPVALGSASAGTHNSPARTDHAHPTTGLVTGVTAADTSVVIGGTATAPTISTGSLDVIAADHPPAANWSNNSHKITSLANGSAASDAAAFGQVLPVAGGVMTGNLELAAGTTSLAPVTFQSGTNLTTATAGDAEFDGTAFYLTAAASSRQVVDTEQIQVLSSPYTLTNDTNPHPLFNASAAGALTVQGSTTYLFEMLLDITGLSSSSHTVQLGFATGGGASLTGILYNALTSSVSGGTATSWMISTASASGIQAAVTATICQAMIKGVIRVNAGGTITPQITQLTASAAATVAANSYFRCWPVGSNTVTNVGNWS